jgi:hypothetical protein
MTEAELLALIDQAEGWTELDLSGISPIAYDQCILVGLGRLTMSLAELLPLVNNLNQTDKLSLFKLLAAEIPDAELQMIFSASEYPVWSPYDATEAATILMQMIQDDRETSTHA